MRLATLFLSLSVLFACSNQVKEVPFQYALFELDTTRLPYFADEHSQPWQPSPNDLLVAEEVIVQVIEAASYSKLLCKDNLNAYIRQYVGFINAENERMLWVNAPKIVLV